MSCHSRPGSCIRSITFDTITRHSDKPSLLRTFDSNSSYTLPLPRRHGEVSRNRHRRTPRLHASSPNTSTPLCSLPALWTRTITRRHRRLINRQLIQVRTNRRRQDRRLLSSHRLTTRLTPRRRRPPQLRQLELHRTLRIELVESERMHCALVAG